MTNLFAVMMLQSTLGIDLAAIWVAHRKPSYSVATIATGVSEPIRHLTPERFGITMLMLAFAVASFLIGMALARRLSKGDDARFVAVSFSCGVRNVTAGAVLASQYFGPEVMFPAIIATPFRQVLAAGFGRLMKWTLAQRQPLS